MAKDKCVLCGAETPYDESVHIDYRIGYVEGAGQVCSDCHSRSESTMDHTKHIVVSLYTIKSTPNDQELGAKVRQLYWESIN